MKNARDLKKCTSAIQEFVLERLNQTIAAKLIDSINVLHDNYVGTLTRCLYSLESNGEEDETESSASKALQEVRRMFFECFLFNTNSFQILHSAYQVNVALPTDSNVFQVLIDKMKEVQRFCFFFQFRLMMSNFFSSFERSVGVIVHVSITNSNDPLH